MDHGPHRQRPRVATQEADLAPAQRPGGPLDVLQRPLQVKGLLGRLVQPQVEQGDACGAETLSRGAALTPALTARRRGRRTRPAGVGGEVVRIGRLQAFLHLLEQVFDLVLDLLLERWAHLRGEKHRLEESEVRQQPGPRSTGARRVSAWQPWTGIARETGWSKVRMNSRPRSCFTCSLTWRPADTSQRH